MNAVCNHLRSALRLYAEGELDDAWAIRRIRRHVAACAACRDYLRAHDTLTRRLLADSDACAAGRRLPDASRAYAFQAQARSERVLSALDGLPRHPIAAPVLRRFGIRVRRLIPAAAAVLLLALVFTGLLFQRPALDGGGALLTSSGVPSHESIRFVSSRDVRRPEPAPPLAELLWARAMDFEEEAMDFDRRNARRIILLGVEENARASRGDGASPHGGRLEGAGASPMQVIVGELAASGFSDGLLLVPVAWSGPHDADRRPVATLRDPVIGMVPRQLHAMAQLRPGRPDRADVDGRPLYRLIPVTSPRAIQPAPTSLPAPMSETSFPFVRRVFQARAGRSVSTWPPGSGTPPYVSRR